MEQQSLETTLELLKGPSDERRFVGLLLAARSLPASDESAVQQVFDAAGPTFFSRLLLPLKQSSFADVDAEQAKKSAATVSLGLSMFAAFSQHPSLAASSDIIKHIPLFLKVIRQGGVSGIVAPEYNSDQDLVGLDESAVQDCMEAVTQIAEASSEGRLVALQSSALEAVVAALTSSKVSKQWAVRLLVALLQEDIAAESARGTDVAPKLVPALSSLLASSTKTAQAQAQSRKAPKAFSKQPAEGLERAENGGDESSSSPGKATSGQSGVSDESSAHEALDKGPDSGAESLTILHALLRILPVSEGSAEEEKLQQSAGNGKQFWPSEARQGLMIMLQAKLPPAQRQAVLQLVAYYAQITPPAWLLGDANASFFTIVVELLRVEVTLLLRDALVQESAVPTSSTTQGVSREGPGSEAADAGQRVQRNETSDDRGLEQRASDNERMKNMPEPVDTPSGQRRAAERAFRGLPPMLQLFESCIQVLAQTSDNEDPNLGNKSMSLPESAASRAMSSLTEIAEALLQFLEELKGRQQEGLLAVAAVRALGRFLAEAPDLEGKRVRALLPWLVALHHGSGLPFLLPLLSQRLGHDAETRERDLWAAACLKSGILNSLADAFKDIVSSEDAPLALYDPCLVFAWLLDYVYGLTGAEDVLSHLDQTACFASADICSAWALECLNSHSGTKDVDPRVLAFMGHIAAFALSMQLKEKAMQRSEVSVVLWSKCVIAALEISDIVIHMPTDGNDSADKSAPYQQLAAMMSLHTEGAQNAGDQNAMRCEKASQHEELVATIEPHTVAILQHCRAAAQLETVKRIATSSRWWKAVSDIEISSTDCKKSAYLRNLKPLIMILSR